MATKFLPRYTQNTRKGGEESEKRRGAEYAEIRRDAGQGILLRRVWPSSLGGNNRIPDHLEDTPQP